MAKPKNKRHGQARHGKVSSEYRAWVSMRGRCNNPQNKNWANWGGRGITVCARWENFENFFADMGPKPAQEYTLERRDNSGPYSFENCIWATRRGQANNTRRNRHINNGDRTLTRSQWARELRLTPETLRKRLHRGWTIEQVQWERAAWDAWRQEILKWQLCWN